MVPHAHVITHMEMQGDPLSHADLQQGRKALVQIIEVERDLTTYGEEVKFGGGKVIRDGMGQGQGVSADVADTIITNALIVDAVAGIVKADVEAAASGAPASAAPEAAARDTFSRARGLSVAWG